MADIRDGALRGSRDNREVAGSTLRSSRPTTVSNKFYEDLGFRATEDEYTAYTENEAAYQSALAGERDKVATAQSAYDDQASALAKAAEDMPGLNEAVDKAWSTYKSDLTGYRVMGPDDTVEATYWLPSSVSDSLSGDGIFSSSHGNYVNVMVKDYRNQELHDSLRNSASELETAFKSEASGPIADELMTYSTQLSDANAAMGEAATQIDTANSTLDLSESEREAEWTALRDKYTQRIESMKEVLGGMTVG